MTDLVVLHEHPEWQKPLFTALEKRGVRFAAFDLTKAAFDPAAVPAARLYFNQASPSAYLRGNARAVPLDSSGQTVSGANPLRTGRSQAGPVARQFL